MYPISRLAWAVILSIVVVTLGFAWKRNHPTTRLEIQTGTPQCPSEDEVLVVIYQDGYNLHEGDLHCVHIDVLGGT